jgi:hypothetical protein
MDWIYLAQDRNQWGAHVNTVMNLWVSSNVGKFLSSCIISGFSRRVQHHEVSYNKCELRNFYKHLITSQM